MATFYLVYIIYVLSVVRNDYCYNTLIRIFLKKSLYPLYKMRLHSNINVELNITLSSP